MAVSRATIRALVRERDEAAERLVRRWTAAIEVLRTPGRRGRGCSVYHTYVDCTDVESGVYKLALTWLGPDYKALLLPPTSPKARTQPVTLRW